MSTWERVGAVRPESLTETRLRLHWASQLLAAVGQSLVAKRDDDSHTASTIDVDTMQLSSGATDTTPPRRVALSLSELRLSVLDDASSEIDTLALDGKTLKDGLAWLGKHFDGRELSFPDYDMPHHAIQDGASFSHEPKEAFRETALWFVNAARVIRGLDVGDDLCWPHHFDHATLISLGGEKTIGVGLSPGDTTYDQPYWYVTPWPYPPVDALPELTAGHWHTEGFVAAILTGADITAKATADEQGAFVDSYLEAGIACSRKLLG